MDEARRGEELGFGTGFISERWNVKGGVVSGRGGVRGDHSHADRHRRNQSQHPPPAHHGIVGDHHASSLRRPVHPGRRPGPRSDLRGLRHPGGDDGANGGLGPSHAPALARRADLQPRRPDGQVPHPFSRSGLQRRHPVGPGGLRTQHARARRPRVRRRHFAHLLHPGDLAAQRQNREVRRGEGGPRPRQRAGVVVLRDRRGPPARRAAAEEDRRAAGHLPAGLRRPARPNQ